MSNPPNSFDEFDADTLAAMDHPSSPLEPSELEDSPPPSHKRARTHPNSEDEGEGEPDTPTHAASPSRGSLGSRHPSSGSDSVGNILGFIRREGRAKYMRPEHVKMAEMFAADSAAVKLVKLYLQNIEITNQLSKIVLSIPVYTVSTALTTNIKDYGSSAMLMSSILNYIIDPVKHVCAVLKHMRFDLPPNIERIPFKKLIGKSLEGPPAEHTNIFTLTQQIAAKAGVTVTIPLCCRIALIRRVHELDSGIRFWHRVNGRLTTLHAQSNGDKNRLVRVYKRLLELDIKTHGGNQDTLELFPAEDILNEQQSQVVSAGETDSGNGVDAVTEE
ncbi:hypothetical protein OF83DRAFT_1178297 [Amylostereum chailletii]|nr:hypothetical protein OF83DRAFT_1178297 [Amylostereum chailletii]